MATSLDVLGAVVAAPVGAPLSENLDVRAIVPAHGSVRPRAARRLRWCETVVLFATLQSVTSRAQMGWRTGEYAPPSRACDIRAPSGRTSIAAAVTVCSVHPRSSWFRSTRSLVRTYLLQSPMRLALAFCEIGPASDFLFDTVVYQSGPYVTSLAVVVTPPPLLAGDVERQLASGRCLDVGHFAVRFLSRRGNCLDDILGFFWCNTDGVLVLTRASGHIHIHDPFVESRPKTHLCLARHAHQHHQCHDGTARLYRCPHLAPLLDLTFRRVQSMNIHRENGGDATSASRWKRDSSVLVASSSSTAKKACSM